ncbi:MAG: thermonuclease family protein [Proteobacteria bacterium]|nr:thermonuclease family protein [Pseudomonadota bacterium]
MTRQFATHLRIAIILAALVSRAAPAAAADVSGTGAAIDGDTIVVAEQRFNLEGIDAPELGQTCQWPSGAIDCGNVARTALLDLVAGARVTCRPKGTDAAGQTIGRCAADGFDIGGNMVHTGWALADRQTGQNYLDIERRAQQAKRGMWKGTFQTPWDWRAGKR